MTVENSGIDEVHEDVRVPVFGKSSMESQLPCGFVDAQGEVHNTVILRQMTGYEEEMMAQDEVNVITRVSNVLAACCESLGSITDKAKIKAAITGEGLSGEEKALTSTDRAAMLLFLRIATVGKIYRSETVCPHCEHSNVSNIDLTSLKITGLDDPKKRMVRFRLPSGKVVILKVQTALEEVAVVKLTGDALLHKSLSMLSRIVTINDVPTPKDMKVGLDLVRGMTTADRRVMRQVVDKMEGGIDLDIEVECAKQSCRKLYKFVLDVGQVFFSSRGEEIELDQIEWL